MLLQRDNLPSCSLPLPRSNRREGTRLPRGVAAGQSRQSESRAAYPPGLGSAELTERGTAFGRIVHFSPFYAPILRKLLVPPGRGQDQGGSRQAEGEPRPPPPVNLSMRCCYRVLILSTSVQSKDIHSLQQKDKIYIIIYIKKRYKSKLDLN